jgi:hypothetical protein
MLARAAVVGGDDYGELERRPNMARRRACYGENAAARRAMGGGEELTVWPRKALDGLGAAEVVGDGGDRRRPRRRGEVDPVRAVVLELVGEA